VIRRLVIGLALAGAAGAVLVAGAGACSSDSTGGGGVPGCPDIQFPDQCPTPPPSWKKDVQPLVVEYCDSCHGNGGPAALQVPLATYQDVFDNRTRSWEQVYKCAMPNTDASLAADAFPTADQRQTMVTWLDICNAPNN
jgi:hypothetical protein